MTSAPLTRAKTTVVVGLGTTQTLAWASSYYLPAVLGAPIATALGMPVTLFFGLFSASLLLGAVVSPWVGRLIDDYGGRPVLSASNAVIAAGLALLGLGQGVWTAGIAWAVLGIGMALGLYDPAFAALTRLYGRAARGPITGITLIAGFASTVGWPASAWFEHAFGWRDACLIWAGLNLFVALPINLLLIPPTPPLPTHPEPARVEAGTAATSMAMWVVAVYFCATAFVTGAMAAHLPRLLEAAGASHDAAIVAGALVGPAQVAARLVEFGLLRMIHPVWSSRIAAALHPLGAAVLAALSPSAVAAFAILHGAGNGMVTIARGTLPLAVFGPIGYGQRTGILAAPSRVVLAAAPFVFGLLLDRMGAAALTVSAGLSVVALAVLLLLRPEPEAESAAAAGD